jgi:hypothetical protein
MLLVPEGTVFVNWAIGSSVLGGISLVLYLYLSDGPVIEQQRFSDDSERQN